MLLFGLGVLKTHQRILNKDKDMARNLVMLINV